MYLSRCSKREVFQHHRTCIPAALAAGVSFLLLAGMNWQWLKKQHEHIRNCNPFLVLLLMEEILPWDVWNPVNNGHICHINWLAWFLPSTVVPAFSDTFCIFLASFCLGLVGLVWGLVSFVDGWTAARAAEVMFNHPSCWNETLLQKPIVETALLKSWMRVVSTSSSWAKPSLCKSLRCLFGKLLPADLSAESHWHLA